MAGVVAKADAAVSKADAELVRRFARVRARPELPKSRREALAVLAELEAASEPSDAGVSIIADDAFLWVGLGLARRVRGLVERWRRGGVRHAALGRAEAIYTVAIAPPAAAGRLRALAGDPVASAVAVANHVFRGELRIAIERCRAEGWFLEEPGAIAGVAYGTWALAMLDDFDGALAVIGMWRHRHPRVSASVDQTLLAAEARIESVRHHHGREIALLEEAIAVCDEHELGLPRAYLEASKAIATARSGDVLTAARITRKWTSARAKRAIDDQALEVYRDVARAEVALLGGHHREADVAARRVLAYSEAAGNAIYACSARGYRALAASRLALQPLVDDYGRAAAQLQIPVHLRRHRLLQQFATADLAPRDRHLFARTRGSHAVLPILRTFFPTVAEVNADLYWDRVQGLLYLSGEGPFLLGEHPVLRRVLETVLQTRAFVIPLGDLFEQVWEMPYRPLVHEGKCHVALHRLRSLLAGWRPGSERLLVVRDGAVRIADECSAVVLELPPTRISDSDTTAATRAAASLPDRITAYLAVAGETTIADLIARLGASRTNLQLALRRLVASKHLERFGNGRATTYKLATRRPRKRA